MKVWKRVSQKEYDRRAREGIPGRRGYWEIIEDLNTTPTWNARKLRKIHKELKPYGNGVPFMWRHPMLPSYLALAFAGVVIVICGLRIFTSIL